ncbi:potential serine/threonine-protein kinase Hsl1 [Pseudozyma hubeiensis SY62]|uniref:Potential serine/threonine-protein kinase Hsl1 n=1 Tax=Pseudozyma hubeiensis (strain SY62) TaxID=1305764 RepID=R9P7S1_PSEHS|nr:potential serine/threonine-protein kinase Hsl1 [Pseudozyma hubeiensis SY62]GAC97443.1 potential serine/threonine-protein kinase Hsl1 [Pseudozyma hubeiensis SY62]
MEAPLVALVRSGTSQLHQDGPLTPDLQHSFYMSGDSDNDSAHPTPSDMTVPAQSGTDGGSNNNKLVIRAEEEVRKIHYIDSPTLDGTSAKATVMEAPSQLAATTRASPLPAAYAAGGPRSDSASTTGAAFSASIAVPATISTPTPAHAPSSAASTPASTLATPGATPQPYARKRGRPRKHPLPDPNAPPKSKRKLSPAGVAAAAARQKAAEVVAARSAASTAGSLLSVPDLGRLIPQGSSSDNAQSFIQNNLRLFADLFVALQKQATTDNSIRIDTHDAVPIQEAARTDPDLDHDGSSSIPVATVAAEDEGSTVALTTPNAGTNRGIAAAEAITSSSTGLADPLAGPSDAIRDEIKKKMVDVTKGREAIQAEMLQMRVDASFFEHAQKTVDERITVLRDRIAKRTALLQREREATRQAREATRKAKKDLKARERGLRESEREERRLAQTFAQLEREIAAEEEERRRLEEGESSDDEGGEQIVARQPLYGMGSTSLGASPSEATSVSATATPSIATDAAMTPDRAVGFSDEELAKVLGISTGELAGFSQTLELTPALSGSPSHPPVGSSRGNDDVAPSTFASAIEPAGDASGSHADGFDVAAFLEMAGSFGSSSTGDPAATQQH